MSWSVARPLLPEPLTEPGEIMGRRLLRHGIVGTEVGQPRPPAYMRPGHVRRSRSRRSRRGRLMALSLLVMALLIFTLVGLWPVTA